MLRIQTKSVVSRRALINPFADFWLLGGASLVVWLAMCIGSWLRTDSQAVQQRFMEIGAAFALLSLVCNHPHFMISYRFGYGRGAKFIFKHWFALIAVPLGMIAAFTLAFFAFDSDLCNSISCEAVNDQLASTSLKFRIGKAALGSELLGYSIWIMYLTVGWHYAKQAYGCMMVYARYTDYSLSRTDKLWIRWALISIAIFQFVGATGANDLAQAAGGTDPRFPGISLSPLGLPAWFETLTSWFTLLANVAVASIFAKNYFKYKAKPSLTLLVPWIALLVWWASPITIPEFFMVVPFFHSLQYLPFAHRAAAKDGESLSYARATLGLLGLLTIGFLAFEYVPNFLDHKFDTEVYQLPWFFVTCFSIFINVHHFFIDSVVWRFQQPEVKTSILNVADLAPATAVVRRPEFIAAAK